MIGSLETQTRDLKNLTKRGRREALNEMLNTHTHTHTQPVHLSEVTLGQPRPSAEARSLWSTLARPFFWLQGLI